MKNKKIFKVFYLVCLLLATTLACQNGPPSTPTGDPVVISYIEMFTQTEGWGIGGEQEPLNHILRTSDGGNTWTDVTPPEPTTVIDDPGKFVMAFFLDTNSAWVTYVSEDRFDIPVDPFIWYTTDGGASWTAGPPFDSGASFYSPLFLHFVDENTGWLMVAIDAGMSHEYTDYFKTQDGGASWAKIIDPMTINSPQVCCKTGLAFADTQTGLLTTEQGPYAEPYVEWTQDGGLTWDSQTLPSPPSTSSSPLYCVGHSPHLFSPQVAVIGLDCRNFNANTTEPYIYKTTDGGTNWQVSGYPGGEIIFLDADEGFALSREIHKTTDGGQIWTHVKTVCWDGQFSFINSDMAWAVGRCDDAIALYHTTNGAKSWNEILPMIE